MYHLGRVVKKMTKPYICRIYRVVVIKCKELTSCDPEVDAGRRATWDEKSTVSAVIYHRVLNAFY
ncbi:hypothetical protein J6590_024256 [Homalodisca vitripennis]|nr:hypothetical protein J6590_024256 [Homalodisca vitripennis]